MPTALCVTAPLLLAAVLTISAIGKLSDPERSRAAFSSMGMPGWLDRPWASRAHPWGELVLAVLLLAVPGPLGVIVATAALLLMLIYLALVIRAVRMPVDVDCACFGALGGERVTTGAVWRNVWLSALAGVTVVCALEGRDVVGRMADLDGASVWWLISVAASALTFALVLGTGARDSLLDADGKPLEDANGLDYVRARTPAIPITLADGTTTDLRRLSKYRAQLLVYVSEGCQSCDAVIRAVPKWQHAMPQLDVRMVVAQRPEMTSLTDTHEPMTAHDPHERVWDTFGLRGTPSAVLLGADGLLAGGPVLGAQAVPEFVAEIQAELGT